MILDDNVYGLYNEYANYIEYLKQIDNWNTIPATMMEYLTNILLKEKNLDDLYN
jgi:hypothetical protein